MMLSMLLLSVVLSLSVCEVAERPAAIVPLPERLNFFPVATQSSPVPSGQGWKGEAGPLSPSVIAATIDNMNEHGFTGIEGPTQHWG
jgi:hypothetical protein